MAFCRIWSRDQDHPRWPCVYFVFSGHTYSAGAPARVTCDMRGGGDREGLISRSRSRSLRAEKLLYCIYRVLYNPDRRFSTRCLRNVETWTIRFTLRIDCLRTKTPCCVFTHFGLEQLCALRIAYCVLCIAYWRFGRGCVLRIAYAYCVLQV